MQSKNVAFRKVNGRIVPIKLRKLSQSGTSEIVKGAAIAATGAAVAAGAGFGYKKINQASTRMAFRAFNAADRITSRAYGPLQSTFASALRKQKAVELAGKLSKKAAAIGSLAPGLRRTGMVGGSLLIGLGAAKVSAAVTKEKNENLNRTVGAAAALAAFKSKSASKLIFQGGAHPRAAAMEAFKKISPHLKKVLQKLD